MDVVESGPEPTPEDKRRQRLRSVAIALAAGWAASVVFRRN